MDLSMFWYIQLVENKEYEANLKLFLTTSPLSLAVLRGSTWLHGLATNRRSLFELNLAGLVIISRDTANRLGTLQYQFPSFQ
jgi:hypothetical protein